MMIEEFEKRTGFYPTLVQYEAIERAYMAFDGDKDAFCKAYKKNADGMAERIQREVNMDAFRQEQHHAAELQRRDAEIKSCDAEIERLKALLDWELEWKPYEFTQNISQVEYTELAKGVSNGSARYMSDEEALDWVCDEFGFDRNQVTILHEIDEKELNRHNHCRASGRKLDRRPVYCANDYHYIRFNAGNGAWQWEAWNGQIRPFYD